MFNDTIRVCVDFNSSTPDGNVVLNGNTVSELEAELGAKIWSGLKLTVFDEEFEVEGSVAFDEKFQVWTVRPEWATHRENTEFGDGS